MHKNNVVGVVTFHLIGLLPTDHIILQWHTGVYEETFDLNIKMAQTVQSIWNFGKSTRVYWRNDYPEELTALGYCLWIVIVINLAKFTQWLLIPWHADAKFLYSAFLTILANKMVEPF